MESRITSATPYCVRTCTVSHAYSHLTESYKGGSEITLPHSNDAPAIEVVGPARQSTKKEEDQGRPRRREWDGITKLVQAYLGGSDGEAAARKIDKWAEASGGLCVETALTK